MSNSASARPAPGRVIDVTPQSAGWTYVGFDLHRLKAGDRVAAETGDREVCLVFVTGKGRSSPAARTSACSASGLSPSKASRGRSMCRPAPTRRSRPQAISNWPSARRPARRRLPARRDRPGRSRPGNPRQGHQHPLRHQHPARDQPSRQPAGGRGDHAGRPLLDPIRRTSTTSDDCPRETLLEETYYHRLDPPQGFAFQRVYTDDRSLDEAMAVEDGDVDAGAERLSPVRRAARLRPLLPQRHGRAEAGLAVPQCCRARVAAWLSVSPTPLGCWKITSSTELPLGRHRSTVPTPYLHVLNRCRIIRSPVGLGCGFDSGADRSGGS